MRQLTEAEIDTTGQDMIRRATKVMNRRVKDMAKKIQVFNQSNHLIIHCACERLAFSFEILYHLIYSLHFRNSLQNFLFFDGS